MKTAEVDRSTTLDGQIAGMDREITKLEAERAELDAPAPALTWDEIQSGGLEDLEARERRRALLPRLIAAARVKRLELQRARRALEMEPLEAARAEAHDRLQATTAKRIKVAEEEGKARFAYSDANGRIESAERHMKAIDREIRELRGEAR